MNIFYLDSDLDNCAKCHTDKHVVKMILESAQLLCTALNIKADKQVTPYKTTHKNHPSAIWVRESLSNFTWLYLLFESLNAEFMYRFNHETPHLSFLKMEKHGMLTLAEKLYSTDEGLTPFKIVVAEDCLINGDPIESYRKYYNTHKKSLFSWTKREPPSWVIN